jgi:hypothetical protein
VDHGEACGGDGLVGGRREATIDGGRLVEEDNDWGWSSSWRCGLRLELGDSGKRRGRDGATLGRLGQQ